MVSSILQYTYKVHMTKGNKRAKIRYEFVS